MAGENRVTPFLLRQGNFFTYTTIAEANQTIVFKETGMIIYISSEDIFYYWTGSTWFPLLASGGSNPVYWGQLLGTLSNQTDLQLALDNKQDVITLGTNLQYFRGDLSLAVFPTSVSYFTNDSGYITASALIPLENDISQLQNNVYKVTYYEIVSGTSGTITPPGGSTINEGEFGLSGNAILSKVDINNNPTYQSPQTITGDVVTVSLNATTGQWVASGIYTDTNVALIYSLQINAVNYGNLVYDNIIETIGINAQEATVQQVKDGVVQDRYVSPYGLANSGYIRYLTNTAVTLNNIPVVIDSIPITIDTGVLIEVRINSWKNSGVGIGTVGSTNSYIRTFKVKNVAGILTLGLVQSTYTSEDIPPHNVSFNINGQNIDVVITGSTNNNISWTSSIIITK